MVERWCGNTPARSPFHINYTACSRAIDAGKIAAGAPAQGGEQVEKQGKAYSST